VNTTDDRVEVTARIKPEAHAQLGQLRHWINVHIDNTVLSVSQLPGWLIDRALQDMHAEQGTAE
jgi:hypothetical protein